MMKKRIIETNEGIQNQLTVEIFDEFAKQMRDKGWNGVNNFFKTGINKGKILEIGPGPGYNGLEWLKKTENTELVGLEISNNMIKMAEKNANEYGFSNRVSYVIGNCLEMPFEANYFDAVISNGSLHEWENPIKAINEIYRVLKPNSYFCITDMRRNVSPLLKLLVYFSTKPKEMRPGFISSLNASYTADELNSIINLSNFKQFNIVKDPFGLCLSGKK
ncbi:MAG: class I SAM-dependent methyltransferase [Clostridia bacterium]